MAELDWSDCAGQKTASEFLISDGQSHRRHPHRHRGGPECLVPELRQHPVPVLIRPVLPAFHPIAGGPRVRRLALLPGRRARRLDGGQPRPRRRIPLEPAAVLGVAGEAHVARFFRLTVGAVDQHRRVRPAERLPLVVQGAHGVHVLGARRAVRRRTVVIPGGDAGGMLHQRFLVRNLPLARAPAGVAVAFHPVARVPVARRGRPREDGAGRLDQDQQVGDPLLPGALPGTVTSVPSENVLSNDACAV